MCIAAVKTHLHLHVKVDPGKIARFRTGARGKGHLQFLSKSSSCLCLASLRLVEPLAEFKTDLGTVGGASDDIREITVRWLKRCRWIKLVCERSKCLQECLKCGPLPLCLFRVPRHVNTPIIICVHLPRVSTRAAFCPGPATSLCPQISRARAASDCLPVDSRPRTKRSTAGAMC